MLTQEIKYQQISNIRITFIAKIQNQQNKNLEVR